MIEQHAECSDVVSDVSIRVLAFVTTRPSFRHLKFATNLFKANLVNAVASPRTMEKEEITIGKNNPFVVHVSRNMTSSNPLVFFTAKHSLERDTCSRFSQRLHSKAFSVGRNIQNVSIQ